MRSGQREHGRFGDHEREVAGRQGVLGQFSEARRAVDEDEVDLSDLDDIDIDDPEADAIVNDALNIDRTDEAEAAAEVLTDSLAEEVAEYAAGHADDVTPYDGPDINGDEDEPVLDEDNLPVMREVNPIPEGHRAMISESEK